MAPTHKFGVILREIRRLKGLTQEELAQKAGRSVDAVSQWERAVNWPSFDTLIRLSVALEIPVRTFFEQTEAPRSDQRLRMEVEARLLLESMTDRDLSIAIEQLRALARRQ